MVLKCLPGLLVTSALVVGLAASVPSASAAAVHNRITTAASNTSPVPVPGSIHPSVRHANDLGATAGNTRLRGMSIRFNLTAEQDAALDQLLADQQNPSSPRYHQWLTPAQYAAQFGLSSTDLAKVSSWLTNQGFTVTGVANGGTFITFDGTVAQVEAAFGTSIHNFSQNGETHFANTSNVEVPGAFAGVVAAVTGLHNFRMKPHVHTSAVRPDYTSSVSGNHYIAPGDLYTMYNMTPLMATYTGAGETVAVIGQVDINQADISAFRSAAGLSATTIQVKLAGTDPGPAKTCTNCYPNQDDLGESSIDLEWSGAMAPAATVDFVLGIDVFYNSMTYAIDNNLAPIIMSSYGACEAGWGTTEMNTLNALFKQGNAQGQTILAASADFGATDCDTGPSAIEGLAVDFPASSPYVTAMGGTQPNEGSGSYWSSSNGPTGGSALSYIPEVAWNDASQGAFGGGGGGSSDYFTKPTWQVEPASAGVAGVPADGARDVPDLALTATDDPTHDSFLYCVNVASGYSCGSGFRVSATNNGLAAAGGTSFDSQIFGGMLALVEQKLGGPVAGRIGNANPTLYALGNSTYYVPGQTTLTNSTVVFNDVTGGGNQMACTAGTVNCGNGGNIGYSAVNGYDRATGWGSVNLTNLANDWSLVTPLGVGTLGSNLSTTSLTASPTSAAVGATVTLTATVTGSAGTPTGNVTFTANNATLGSPVAVTATNGTTGTATYTWITACSNLGQQVINAYYSGDGSYQGSVGPVLTAGGSTTTSNGSFAVTPIEVQVTSGTCPDFSLIPSTGTGITVSGSNASVTVAAGGTIPAVTVSATPANNFTGTVVFSSVVTSTSGYIPTVTFSQPSAVITSSSPVTTTVTLSGIVADLHLPAAPGKPGSHNAPWYAAGSGVTLAALLLVFPRRRRLGGLLLVALAIGLVGGTTGCGGSSQAGPPSSGSSNTNVYAGTYVVTVVGKYTSSSGQVSQHVSTITYVIN